MGFSLGWQAMLLGISLGLRPQEIPRSSPASPRKTPPIPPLLLRLTQYKWKRETYLVQICPNAHPDAHSGNL